MSNVKTYFDSRVHHHPYDRDPSYFLSIINFMQRVKPEGTLCILDVGCGTGNFLKSMITTGIDGIFFGTDVSANMVNIAKNNLAEYEQVRLFVADGLKLPLQTGIKFDLIHMSFVLQHLIRKTRSQSLHLVDSMLKLMKDRLSSNGVLVIEEVYYLSHLFPQITSSIIFYGLKFLNFLHMDLSRMREEFQPGLEVNFLSDREIEELLGAYGDFELIKKKPTWNKVPRFYQFFLFKGSGPYFVYGKSRPITTTLNSIRK